MNSNLNPNAQPLRSTERRDHDSIESYERQPLLNRDGYDEGGDIDLDVALSQAGSDSRSPTGLKKQDSSGIRRTTRLNAWFDRLCLYLDTYPFNPLGLSHGSSSSLSTTCFLLIWFLANVILIRQSWYVAMTEATDSPRWLDCIDSLWFKDEVCGLNGTDCKPFDKVTWDFRCPSMCRGTMLLNPRVVGGQVVNYQPLVVGGAKRSNYRSDSFVCQAAIHAGVITERRGGCGRINLMGTTETFESSKSNGIQSLAVPAEFPSSFSLQSVKGTSCQDIWDLILVLNVLGSLLFTVVLRPSPRLFFWVLCFVGYWTVVFSSEPNDIPPSISKGLGIFLPFLFVCYWIWDIAWAGVSECFKDLERLLFYLLPWWFGVLMNLTLGWIPIDRLTVHDIQQRPGGILAAIVVGLLVLILVSYQLWSLNKAKRLKQITAAYLLVGLILCLLATVPAHLVRLHHYIIGIFLTPLTSIPTRPSAIFQGFLLGMIQNGLGRWSFASILEKTQDVIGDGDQFFGSLKMPEFDLKSSGFIDQKNQLTISWKNHIDQETVGVLVNDVLRYIGNNHKFSFRVINQTAPVYFFRLAFFESIGFTRIGQFTKPITFFVGNQTWFEHPST